MIEEGKPVFLVEPLGVQLRALQAQWIAEPGDCPEAREYCADDLQPIIDRVDELENAVACAVDYAFYVEARSKGEMSLGARRFLQLPYALTIAAELKKARGES